LQLPCVLKMVLFSRFAFLSMTPTSFFFAFLVKVTQWNGVNVILKWQVKKNPQISMYLYF
jgi:hypothetical protein